MKPIHWILAGLLFLILGLCFYLNWYDSKSLSDCSKSTKGLLIDAYKLPKKGYTFVYRYKIKGKTYENHEWIQGEFLDKYSIGDSILIHYACQDHQVSKVY